MSKYYLSFVLFLGKTYTPSRSTSTLMRIMLMKQLSSWSSLASLIPTYVVCGSPIPQGLFRVLFLAPLLLPKSPTFSARFGILQEDDDDSSDSEEDVQEQPRLVLPHLHSLTLNICGGYKVEVDINAISVIHDTITLPSLEHLAYTSSTTARMFIYDPDSDSSIFITSLSRMLERSNSPLSSFRLESIPIKDVDLVSLLKQMTRLEVFEVRGADESSTSQLFYKGNHPHIVTITSQLLEALTLNSTNAQLLPRLRPIVLWIRTDWGDGQYPFETLLESRSQGTSPLESVYLHLVDETEDA
ncbi:hypothetical protein VNI00_017535 [Paramarasmius palmivorus]|uniref:Uncharacterized protein n=1 Tax=Paramarasmius palmivorus TaxID=297713 RepID=A0AAW0B6J7_9AGAR